MYVSHYKADSGSTNLTRRNVEATEIRQDADALGSNAHIIYSGDFNLTGASSEAAWTTLTASGNGQAHDPTGVAAWTNSNTGLNYLYSESTSSLSARFDFQLVSNAMLTQPGLQLAADTSDPLTGNYPSSKYPYAYEVFGNNGTTALNGITNSAGNTSLSDLSNASTVLKDLMKPYSGNNNQFVGSDHLPVVADYSLVGVSPLSPTWSGGGNDNNWSTAANWSSAFTNDSSLTFAGTTRTSNSNDMLTSVGSITFANGAGGFILSGSSLFISGGVTNNSANTQTINLNLTLSAPQQFNAASGNLKIGGTIANGGNSLTVTGSSNTTITGSVSGAGALVMSGSGTLTLTNSNSYSGGSTVNNGTLVVANVNGLGTGGLSVGSGAAAKLSTGTAARPVVVPSVSINGNASPTGTLDISTSKMVITNTSFAGAQAAYSTAHAQVANAFDGFAWDLPGITSSQVQTDINVNGIPTAVGIVLNNDTAGGNLFYGDGTGGFPQFAGDSVDFNSILFKYTYIGDSNLDGMVDSTDFGLFLAGYNDPGTAASLGWAVGDYDYSGTVDSTDFGLFLAGYNYYASNPVPLNGAGGVQPVPEPAAFLLAALGLAAMAISRLRDRTTSTSRSR